jgi:hypothetical protein
MLHDFLTQQNELEPNTLIKNFGRAHLVYAEDYLKHVLEQTHDVNVHPGQILGLKGEQIMQAISEAQKLSEEQLQNLNENIVPKISEETWEKITDYTKTYEPANDFAKAAKETAANILAKTAQTATGEHVITGVKDLQKTVIQEAQEQAHKNETLKTILYAAGGLVTAAGSLFGIHKLAERGEKKRLEKTKQTSSEMPKEVLETTRPATEQLPKPKSRKEKQPKFEQKTQRTREEVDGLVEQIRTKYRASIIDNSDSDDAGNYDAIKKIDTALNEISKDKIEGLTLKPGKKK